MIGHSFDSRVEAARRRLEELAAQAEALPPEHRTAVREAREQFLAVLEELAVAGEELQQQHEELLAASEKVQALQWRYQELFDFAPDGYLLTDGHGTIREANHTAARMLNCGRELLVGVPLLGFLPSSDKRAFMQVLAELAASARALSGLEFQIKPKGGLPLWSELSVATVCDLNGKTTGLRWLVRDISDRKRSAQRANAITTLLGLFARRSTRKDYLDAVVSVVQRWSGCRCVGIRVVDERAQIPYESHVGFDEKFWEQENWLSLERDHCACIRVVRGEPGPQDAPAMTPGGSFCLNDAKAFVASLSPSELARFRGTCVRSGYASIAIAPVRYRDRTLGAIHLADERTDALPAQAVEFIESLTPLIGEAVNRFNIEAELRRANNQLRSLAAQLTMSEEQVRRRIATLLHDGIGQTLVLTKLKFGMLRQASSDSSKAAINELRGLLDRTIQQTRLLTFELTPPALYELGLTAALEQLAEQAGQQYGLVVAFHDDGQPKPVSVELRIILFQATRELLLNVSKHARAGRIEVITEKTDGFVRLSVRDDGVGFSPDKMAPFVFGSGGFGLFNIRERLEYFGGRLQIESQPGHGTRITLEAPLDPEAEAPTPRPASS